MTTLDSSPSNNGRGSDAWSRPGTDLGIDRRGAGYCRVTLDHAPMDVTGATVCIPPAPSPHAHSLKTSTGARTPATGLRFHVVDGTQCGWPAARRLSTDVLAKQSPPHKRTEDHMSKTATYMGKPYYPWWLNELADDVTGQGAAIEGALQGPEEVRTLVLDARELYEDQELSFVGDFGEDGFLEEYTCEIRGVPASAVVTVHRSATGQAQSIVVNHRPRSAVLQFARLMGEKYVGTPMEKYFRLDE